MQNQLKKLIKTSLFLLVLVLFTSCQNVEFDTEKIYGEWKVVDWEIVTTGEKRGNQMDMLFVKEDDYVVDYGSEKEEGKFWIRNQYLYTLENGEAEKKVKLLDLKTDTLSFQMNRAGEIENVLLVKK